MSDKAASFSQRLREALDARGMKQVELAEKSQISKSSISRYLKGDWEGKQSAVYALAKALGVTEAWLMGYDVPMEESHTALSSKDEAYIPPGFQPLPETELLPRVGQIACGEPILAEQNIENYDRVPTEWGAQFTLVCAGDSMLPRIQDGDVVAIRKQPSVENGEIAAVRIGDEATLKHVYYSPDKLILQPENPAYTPIVLLGDEINTATIEGKAVGLCRRI